MLKLIVRWVVGYIKCIASGPSKERFINICKNNNIVLKKLVYSEKGISFVIDRRQYKNALTYAKKTDTKLEIINKKGLPFIFYRYKKRKVFALFFILFAGLTYYSTFFIWNINVTCGEYYTDVQIKKYICDAYVPIGTSIKSIDCNQLEKDLRKEFDKIAWISCEISGTQLNVVFTETIEPYMIDNMEEPCNIVALKDAVITDIITNNGMALYKAGDEVKAGDTIITGTLNITNDYDELIETRNVTASGYVYGIVKYNYNDTFNLTIADKNYTDSNKTYTLFIAGREFSLGKISEDESTDIIVEDDQICMFKDFYLPIGIHTKTSKKYNVEVRELSQEEARERAEKRLAVYIDELQKKGVEILENNVKIEISNGTCRAKGTILVNELIGVPVKINLIDQGDRQ